jgi:16S rRNA (guanine(966)-N(2))-methyltransferase RsmD
MYKWGLPENAAAADLFCGTGSMGLEALSRGARHVTFVDRDRFVIEILEKNIAKAGFVDRTRTICHNVINIGAPAEEELYDLVFVDPPYEMSTSCDIGTRIYNLMKIINLQVKEGAIIILRTHQRALVLELYGEMERIDCREWGNMKVTFFQKQPREKLLEKIREIE